MKKVLIIVIATALVAAAYGECGYEGTWGQTGSALGSFNGPCGIDAVRNENVYVADEYNHRV
jgi:hypothetical protein